MRNYELSEFAKSAPLITPHQLEADRSAILDIVAPWASDAFFVDPELESGSDMVALRIRSTLDRGASTKASKRDENGGVWFLTVSDFAACCELTRYGNSIVVNTNSPAEDGSALFYLKVAFAGASEDNLPVARLVVGAGARERVTLRRRGEAAPKWLTRNLHPEHLSREGAGKPEKDARAVAIAHAERRAVTEGGLPEAGLRAYVENLRALYAYHDGLYGVTWEG